MLPLDNVLALSSISTSNLQEALSQCIMSRAPAVSELVIVMCVVYEFK